MRNFRSSSSCGSKGGCDNLCKTDKFHFGMFLELLGFVPIETGNESGNVHGVANV